jgi:hypothetical protein
MPRLPLWLFDPAGPCLAAAGSNAAARACGSWSTKPLSWTTPRRSGAALGWLLPCPPALHAHWQELVGRGRDRRSPCPISVRPARHGDRPWLEIPAALRPGLQAVGGQGANAAYLGGSERIATLWVKSSRVKPPMAQSSSIEGFAAGDHNGKPKPMIQARWHGSSNPPRSPLAPAAAPAAVRPLPAPRPPRSAPSPPEPQGQPPAARSPQPAVLETATSPAGRC